MAVSKRAQRGDPELPVDNLASHSVFTYRQTCLSGTVTSDAALIIILILKCELCRLLEYFSKMITEGLIEQIIASDSIVSLKHSREETVITHINND